MENNKCYKVYSFNENDIKLETIDLPQLTQPGEVLINISSCSLNNYDTLQLQGKKGPLNFPIIPGHEACGIITQAFSDEDKDLVNKFAAFWANGTICEYIKINKQDLIILPEDFNSSQGAVAYVNPITATGLVDTVKSHNTKAFISTAANSSIGIMINKIAKAEGLTVINVVRSKSRVEEMQSLGFEYVLDSTDEGFKSNLSEMVKKFEVKVAIDPLSGEIVSELIKALPHGGFYINYGTHTGKPFTVDATDLRWGEKQIKSFLFSYWFNKQENKQKVLDSIFQNYENIFKQNIQEEMSMWDFPAGLKKYNEAVQSNARFIFFNKY
jgi:NADPH:quinone reductase-like Zn-dependent oxidoreductase